MRLTVLTVMGLLLLPQSGFAADDAAAADSASATTEAVAATATTSSEQVDIMDFYQPSRRAHRDKSVATSKAYRDRWYSYASERYGTNVVNPHQDAGAPASGSGDAYNQ